MSDEWRWTADRSSRCGVVVAMSDVRRMTTHRSSRCPAGWSGDRSLVLTNTRSYAGGNGSGRCCRTDDPRPPAHASRLQPVDPPVPRRRAGARAGGGVPRRRRHVVGPGHCRRATTAGAWLAVVDVPWLGVEAAVELGIPLERLVRVDPGPDGSKSDVGRSRRRRPRRVRGRRDPGPPAACRRRSPGACRPGCRPAKRC